MKQIDTVILNALLEKLRILAKWAGFYNKNLTNRILDVVNQFESNMEQV